MTDAFLFSYAALWIVVGVLLILLIGVLRHIGILYERYSQIRPAVRTGQRVKDLKLATLDGGAVMLSSAVSGITNIIVIGTQCSACHNLLQFIRDGRSVLDTSYPIVIVSTGDPLGTRMMLEAAGLSDPVTTLVDPDGILIQQWGILSIPHSFQVDSELRVNRQSVGAIHSVAPLDNSIHVAPGSQIEEARP
ncbi:MAG: TlpA family protein disulfide reductase [Chloroflexota bacterium]